MSDTEATPTASGLVWHTFFQKPPGWDVTLLLSPDTLAAWEEQQRLQTIDRGLTNARGNITPAFAALCQVLLDYLADSDADAATQGINAILTETGLDVVIENTVVAPVPAVTSIAPTSMEVGSPGVPDVLLTVTGTGFTPRSLIRFGAHLESATYVSPTTVTMEISRHLFTGANAAVPVTVYNPAPGGGESNAVNFAITDPPPPAVPPVLTSIDPDHAAWNDPITLNGSGLANANSVNFSGNNVVAATFTTHTDTVIELPIPMAMPVGAKQVSVWDPTQLVSSNALPFTVDDPPS